MQAEQVYHYVISKACGLDYSSYKRASAGLIPLLIQRGYCQWVDRCLREHDSIIQECFDRH